MMKGKPQMFSELHIMVDEEDILKFIIKEKTLTLLIPCNPFEINLFESSPKRCSLHNTPP